MILDQLRVANWLASKDGAKGTNRPKPISPLAQDKKPSRTGNTEGRDMADVISLLERAAGRALPTIEGSTDVNH